MVWPWNDDFVLFFFPKKIKCWNCLLAHKHGVACDKIVICGGMWCDVMAASQVCCRVCVCARVGASVSVWVCLQEFGGLRLGGSRGESMQRGRGTSQVGKGPTWGLRKTYITSLSAMQFVDMELWHCDTKSTHTQAASFYDTHETKMGKVSFHASHVKVYILESTLSSTTPAPEN